MVRRSRASYTPLHIGIVGLLRNGDGPTAMLRGDIYAVAALVGAAVAIIGSMLHFPSAAATIVGAALCFGLRFTARRGWQAPMARRSTRSRSTSHTPADRTEDGAKKP